MYRNFVFTDVSQALPGLMRQLMLAEETGSRAGRTKEMTHVGISLLSPWQREILVKHRKPSIAAQIAETVWVLAGRDDIDWLAHYLPRAPDFSDDGKRWRAAYGTRLRSWPRRDGTTETVDQLRYVVEQLRDKPDTRQAVMNVWDPVVDTAPGKDIPCNDWLSFLSRNDKLDLHVAVRSNDAIWGWSGINAFEWSTLLEVVAGLTMRKTGALHFSVTSFHLYEHHWAKADKIASWSPEEFAARPSHSPRFDGSAVNWDLDQLDEALREWFQIEQSIRTGRNIVWEHGIETDRAVDNFPEPMLRSWLRVIQWWWTGDRKYLLPLAGYALETATQEAFSVQPKQPIERRHDAIDELQTSLLEAAPSPFIQQLTALHTEKHKAYGNSWKKRGEMLGIMANIARKIDRIESGTTTADESQADTVGDLFVYLAKYHTWLVDRGVAPGPVVTYSPDRPDLSDGPDYANSYMRDVEVRAGDDSVFNPVFTQEWLVKTFDRLEDAVTRQDKLRHELVDEMAIEAYKLAKHLWWQVQRPAEFAEESGYRGADAD